MNQPKGQPSPPPKAPAAVEKPAHAGSPPTVDIPPSTRRVPEPPDNLRAREDAFKRRRGTARKD